jgi:hypothetical protein
MSPNPQVANELSMVAPAMARLYVRIKVVLYCVVKYPIQLLPPLCVPGSITIIRHHLRRLLNKKQ